LKRGPSTGPPVIFYCPPRGEILGGSVYANRGEVAGGLIGTPAPGTVFRSAKDGERQRATAAATLFAKLRPGLEQATERRRLCLMPGDAAVQ
jgi:hypothetical protein